MLICEIRFFVPTIKELQKRNDIFLMCLSNGNYEGLGKIREKELINACKVLGFKEPPVCLDVPELQDGPGNDWSEEKILELVKEYLESNPMDIIVTFDEYGISYHPNHIKIPLAMAKLFDSEEHVVDLMCLKTVNLFRKYISLVDIQLAEHGCDHYFNFNAF